MQSGRARRLSNRRLDEAAKTNRENLEEHLGHG
jgi:hypothetical protein